ASGGAMSEESEAGDIRSRSNPAAVWEMRADEINARHGCDRFLLERPRDRAALDCGRNGPGAERFGKQKQIARSRFCIRHDVTKVDHPRDSKAVERFR